ncbi:hypothetical protein Vadar_020032 [Vaccinium darrowii]|uniref:Uncharacterized protein n=1 Tax=Vaccinium darrowii TaxID=229202 RepID=A0ACB7YXU4_9ERIC|nr:hypothetical protein Vadar_020032 [Vaccinium darrowii]
MLLSLKFNNDNFNNCPTCAGIIPEILLEERSKVKLFKLVQLENFQWDFTSNRIPTKIQKCQILAFCPDCLCNELAIFFRYEDYNGPSVPLPAVVQARLKEGISQGPESLRSPAFKEQVFTEVLGQDKNGRVRTYGNGPCPSQVFGTRFTRSQELHDREQLCEEVRKEVVDEVQKQVVDEVRKEVLVEFGDRFSRLERKCARLEAHAKDIGYPLPPCSEEDSPIEYSRNGQQPCNVKHVPDPSGPQQQNGDDRFGFFSNWTDNELINPELLWFHVICQGDSMEELQVALGLMFLGNNRRSSCPVIEFLEKSNSTTLVRFAIESRIVPEKELVERSRYTRFDTRPMLVELHEIPRQLHGLEAEELPFVWLTIHELTIVWLGRLCFHRRSASTSGFCGG